MINLVRFIPQIEELGSRIVPSTTVAEVEGNNSFAAYQPLNNDDTYSVKGAISDLSDLDYYGFYVSKGSPIHANVKASKVTGDLHTEFDPTIGLFSPAGKLLATNDDSGQGSHWAAALTVTAPESGVYRLAIGHYNDFTFQGGNTRPGYNGNPNTGPGLHVGGYVFDLSGAQKPDIVVANADGKTTFNFDSDSAGTPGMPTVTVKVVGIAPVPGQTPTFTWQTKVDYVASEYPAQKGVRGSGVNETTPYDAGQSSNADMSYTPNFLANKVATLRGGNVLFEAQAKIGNITVTAKNTTRTPATQAAPTGTLRVDRILILGTDPTDVQVRAYIATKGVPANFPAHAGLTYYQVLGRIVRDESSVHQFSPDGAPLWSRDNLHGAGLMQITPAGTEQRWNWQKNVDAGVEKFSYALGVAGRLFAPANSPGVTSTSIALTTLPARTAQGQLQFGQTIQMPPVDDGMVLNEAIRVYNGVGSPALHEYRLRRNANGTFATQMAGTAVRAVWERVPISERTSGTPNYVDDVLGQPDL